jgi:hypothetical protein
MLWLVLFSAIQGPISALDCLIVRAKKAEKIALWPHFFALGGCKR